MTDRFDGPRDLQLLPPQLKSAHRRSPCPQSSGTFSNGMSRSTRDVLYRIYVIIHIFPTILLALPAVLPSSIVPAPCLKPLQWYLSSYNDPLAGKKSYPGGWFGG